MELSTGTDGVRLSLEAEAEVIGAAAEVTQRVVVVVTSSVMVVSTQPMA